MTQAATTSPTIAELGLWLVAVKREWRQLDIVTPDEALRRRIAERSSVLLQQELSIEHLISTLPAVSIADAAIQTGALVSVAEIIADMDWNAEKSSRLSDLSGAMHRLSLSILPVIAAAAGFDLAAMGWEQAVNIRATLFGSGGEQEAAADSRKAAAILDLARGEASNPPTSHSEVRS